MKIPVKKIKKIRDAHRAGRNVLKAKGLPCESSRVAVEVERHQWAWRPSKVRFLLVAESHVFTDDDDLRVRIRREVLPRRLRHRPDTFVRLVYCLGYGENNLLNKRPESNPGTRQYWNIFGRLAGTSPKPRGGGRLFKDRLKWKLETLTR